MAIKLMIVDDSNIIRSKITRTLSQYDMKVVATANDGKEAARLCGETRPDVITMDLTMPNMDGLECIRAIRKINSSARILVVSALADKVTAIQALKEGAQGFLCKPFSETDLTEAMEELLGEDVDG
jgi:two-component system chemotaxis response regulator CheY